VLQQLAVLAQGSPEEIVLEQLRAREPAEVESVARRAGLAADDARAAVQRLLDSQAALALNGSNSHLDGRTYIVSSDGWRSLTDRVEAILSGFHRSYPLRRGLPKEELRTRLGADPRLFVRVLERLEAQGTAAEDGPFVRLAGHTVGFSPEQERQSAELLALLREAGVAPPDRAELEATLRISPELTDALLAQGRLVEAAPGLLYERETLDALVARIRAALADGPKTVAQIRDLLDASRKYVLALVAYTDEHKITRRVGDERVLY
jgi:selenocysteine-specific elongation factor